MRMGKIRPILFNTDMVRAILDGRKTVTRCLVELQPEREYPIYNMLDSETKKTVSEIAKKYPVSIEWVATILIKCEFDLQKTEAYIASQLMR